MPSISKTLETPSRVISSTLGTQSHLEISDKMSQSVFAEQLKTFDSDKNNQQSLLPTDIIALFARVINE